MQAADGSEAVRTVRHYRGSIDLLVVDIVVPGAPGPAVVREIQKSPSPVGVVYISAYPTSKLLAERRVSPPTSVCRSPSTPRRWRRAWIRRWRRAWTRRWHAQQGD